MTKKTLTEIIKAIMITAKLGPDFEGDFYLNSGAETIRDFCEGACTYFDLPRDHRMFHFCNIGYLDTPSSTIEFFLERADELN